jgi:hypothetical protein
MMLVVRHGVFLPYRKRTRFHEIADTDSDEQEVTQNAPAQDFKLTVDMLKGLDPTT